MTRSHAPKGIDMATWLRLRAERRGQAGVIAGYVHELSDRHSGGNGEGSAGGSGDAAQTASGSDAGGGA